MFIPKARQFTSYFGFSNPPLFFDNDSDDDGIGDRNDLLRTLGTRRREILTTIAAIDNPINVVAYFGHGHDSKLLSAGFRNDSHREAFADAIVGKSQGVGSIVVILYACSSGSSYAITPLCFFVIVEIMKGEGNSKSCRPWVWHCSRAAVKLQTESSSYPIPRIYFAHHRASLIVGKTEAMI